MSAVFVVREILFGNSFCTQSSASLEKRVLSSGEICVGKSAALGKVMLGSDALFGADSLLFFGTQDTSKVVEAMRGRIIFFMKSLMAGRTFAARPQKG